MISPFHIPRYFPLQMVQELSMLREDQSYFIDHYLGKVRLCSEGPKGPIFGEWGGGRERKGRGKGRKDGEMGGGR